MTTKRKLKKGAGPPPGESRNLGQCVFRHSCEGRQDSGFRREDAKIILFAFLGLFFMVSQSRAVPWDIQDPNKNKDFYQDPEKYSRSRTNPLKSQDLKEHKEKLQLIRKGLFGGEDIPVHAQLKIGPSDSKKGGDLLPG